MSLCSHCLHLHSWFQSFWASQSTAFPLALIYLMDFAIALNKESVETLEILFNFMWLVKKNTSRGRGQTQILREVRDGSVQWNGEDPQPRWKDEGSEGQHVAASTKPPDVSGWLLLTSPTLVKLTQWICVVTSRRASVRPFYGLVHLAIVYFHVYLQASTVTFLLHF